MKNDTAMQIQQLMNDKILKEAELEAIKKKLRQLILNTLK
jgi:hypothetical protein